MQNSDEASPSINLAGRALLLKMLITLGPLGIFASNFVYLCNLTLPSHWYAKLLIAQPAGLHYNHCVSPSVRPLSVSENAYNS